jgi:hypothetical protein
MKYSIVYKVLVRTICVEYYRLNAGFFFVIIGFAFGLLRPIEHIALATYFVHSSVMLALLFVLWTLYTLKTIQFTLRSFAQEENTFLHNLYVMPVPVKFLSLVLVQVILFEPIVLYSAFMAFYALRFQQYTALLLLVLFNISSICAAAIYYVFRLRHSNAEVKQSRLGLYLNRHFTKPYLAFFLYHVLNKQLSLFVLTKVFSLLFIIGTIKLYTIEDHSQVLLSLGMLTAFSANAVLTFHFNRFEQVDVLLFKNMPLSPVRRFGYNVLTYVCLLVPEILLLLRHLAGDIQVWMACKLLLFGLSLQLVLHSYVLYRQLDLEKFIRHIFFIILFFFVCLLFRIDVGLLAAVNLAASLLMYRKYFYPAEMVILPEEAETE